MLRKAIYLGLIGLTAGLFSVSAFAVKPGSTDGEPDYNGNGSPSGPHYNLNILGMEKTKGKTSEQTLQSKGHRIFVPLNNRGGAAAKIMLQPGPDFEVIDYDGTDGEAIFQLPNPDPECTGETTYSVYARALGKPGTDAEIMTCADDYDDNVPTAYCNSGDDITVLERGNGKSSFTNVSKSLLYITVNIDGYLASYPIFGDPEFDYWWEYDNNGLRLAQIRFYQNLSTTIDGPIGDGSDDCTFPYNDPNVPDVTP